ncbi:MAG: hypothetical protein NTY17_10510 [Planctomycetia bacterium]|nr:hypothetical protein [Planctomycetia bacterium]
MIPVIEHSSLLIILYWLLMIPIAILVLVRVTAFWADDGPGTLFGALRTIVVMALAVFLTFDISGYVFARMMQDPQLGIAFPPGYHYWNWIREPQSLKWHVLGYVPLIRYLPVMFALCAGAIVQVLLWKIPFRTGMIVFVNQLLVDIFAMAMLSLVFSFFVGVQEGANAKTHPRHAAGGHAGGHAGAHAGGRSMAAVPDGLPGMQHRIEQLGAEEGPMVRRLWRRWESVNQLLRPLYDLLQPVTRHLPLPARDFLNGGGWLIVIPGVIALLRSWPSLRPRKSPGVL